MGPQGKPGDSGPGPESFSVHLEAKDEETFLKHETDADLMFRTSGGTLLDLRIAGVRVSGGCDFNGFVTAA